MDESRKVRMTDPLDPKELATIEELAISTMWGLAALVEVLERKGALTQQEIYAAIDALRERHPEATSSEPPAPDTQVTAGNGAGEPSSLH